MSQPPITSEQLAALPADVQALVRSLLEYYERRIAELEARLNRTPQNSSLPPSSQHPHATPALPRGKSKKKRGGELNGPQTFQVRGGRRIWTCLSRTAAGAPAAGAAVAASADRARALKHWRNEETLMHAPEKVDQAGIFQLDFC